MSSPQSKIIATSPIHWHIGNAKNFCQVSRL